jgi:hypothetical protein
MAGFGHNVILINIKVFEGNILNILVKDLLQSEHRLFNCNEKNKR